MPFKGQIGDQVKKCHTNEIFGGHKVEDSEKEKQWILFNDMVLQDFFFLEQPLGKLANQSLMPCDEWLTGGWMQQVGWQLN